MAYFLSVSFPSVQESPSPYSPFSRKNLVYEISLRVAPSSRQLQALPYAQRLVQTLLQGELLGDYDLLDFLIWPEGLLTRICLGKTPSLAEFLEFLKEKSTPSPQDYRNYWQDEPQWIRLVPPEKLAESTRSFLETADSIRREVSGAGVFSSNLFFFYRHSRLNP
jgi:hypothetical protein